MDKGTLISLALKLVEESLYARAYMDVLSQFNDNVEKYQEEVLVSSTFYGVVESALIEALTIRLARLYDHSDKGIGIGYFMRLVENAKEFFPISIDENTVIEEGHENEYDLPFLYTVKSCEECYFTQKIVDRDELIRKAGFPVSHTKTITVTHQEIIDVYHKRFSSLGRQKEALREQRNKIYAHNDKGIRFSFEKVARHNPLSLDDYESLIEFACDYTSYCYGMLTNSTVIMRMNNIDDWLATLRLVKKGLANKSRQNNIRSSEVIP